VTTPVPDGPPADLTFSTRSDVVEKTDAEEVQLANPVEDRSAELRRAIALATTRVRDRCPFVSPALTDRCLKVHGDPLRAAAARHHPFQVMTERGGRGWLDPDRTTLGAVEPVTPAGAGELEVGHQCGSRTNQRRFVSLQPSEEEVMFALQGAWIAFGLLGLIIWIAIAFWPARVAGRKGHSFIGYFILSLVFFPLSLLLAYLADDRR